MSNQFQRIGPETYTESWSANPQAGLQPGHILVRGHEERAELKIVAVQNGRVYARPLNWWEGMFR
jgi:hypothetical protein